MENTAFDTYLETAGKMVIEYAPKVAGALLILLVGFRIINRLVRLAVNSMAAHRMGSDLAPFLGSIIGIGLKIMLLFTVAGVLGIDVASFVAVLAAAGFAVGLALQGSLSNFAAGIIIILFRPYRMGDWIQVPGEFFGQVEEVQIFNTVLATPGRKTLIVPNSQVINGVVTNYSRKGHIRIELTVLMGYAESFPRIKAIILESLRGIDIILQDPPPQVGIESYDSHNLIIAVRPFVRPDDFWQATFAVNEAIKAAFSANQIKMAYSDGVELGDIGN